MILAMRAVLDQLASRTHALIWIWISLHGHNHVWWYSGPEGCPIASEPVGERDLFCIEHERIAKSCAYFSPMLKQVREFNLFREYFTHCGLCLRTHNVMRRHCRNTNPCGPSSPGLGLIPSALSLAARDLLMSRRSKERSLQGAPYASMCI